MNYLDSYTRRTCKFEILAEISFHNKNQTIKLLCSRLLARHCYSKQDKNCSEIILSCEGNDSPSIQEQFSNLSTSDESQQNAKWYAYWEKYGEDFVNETWIKQYENCGLDDFPTNIENAYQEHCEQQYNVLYWKFINEMSIADAKTEEPNDEESENNQCGSDYSKELDHVSNFDFLYKYKHFKKVHDKLVKAYQAISIMGYTYSDQNTYESAFVEYLKTNLVKSTRHLNMYRFPKTRELSNADDSLCDSDHLVKNKRDKSKKTIKKEVWKQNKNNHDLENFEKFGYTYLQNNPKLMKYWKKRHLLFSEFEKGIQLDEESWYSVTPEIISYHIAERCSCFLIVDPFCGAGGNIIQFAKTCELVIAIDNDPKKIELARHNAELYGVADRIQFIIGDFFALAPTLKADVVFLSPPWGGPELMNFEEYKLSNVMPENGGIQNILSLARKITSNIALHLPKNTNIFDCINSTDDDFVEVQQNVLNSRYNSLTVYFSELYGLCDENIDNFDENFEKIDLI
ncbi:trimethylguanosine synthase-like [Sipha flava]|uniref:Trimethylguanosine synthase n=1 Tax=Sipha flava TaxID=143950 RepID=A0A2S2Q6L1_9HEMI|nr:trimethylguanosine synthase-like [Sipha flava]